MNKSVVLVCPLEGDPQPVYDWILDSVVLLNNNEKASNYQTLPSGELQIDLVSYDDARTYHCSARNEFGQALATVKLIVHGKTLHNFL